MTTVQKRALVAKVNALGYTCFYRPRKDKVSLNGFPEQPWIMMQARLEQLVDTIVPVTNDTKTT